MSEHTVFCHSLKAVMTAAVLVFAAAEAVADELPEGYVRLGYVDFTGEQYVDTLVTPTSTDFGFDLDFVCESQFNSQGD